ncbi:SCA7-domain-containing protein [Patellaria atrata CBS 101060]|uniref:SCA7-domain-containing protein n=1 Tax=Patellaria atrata CBS 101060 TaxID=1346257 RepID=A0A9P4VQP6_9PEZI|nr:SCA7-domain-containing protein [Patellaria atrata CBS 101060]
MSSSTNGARKAPPKPIPPPTKLSLGRKVKDAAQEEFSDVIGKAGTIKIKKPGVKQTKPGNWKESEIIDPNKNDDAPTKPDGADSPLVNPIDPSIAIAFPTGKPLEDKIDTVQCKHCKRPVLKATATKHIQDCLAKKQEKQRKKKEAKEAKDAALRKEKGLDKASEAGDDMETNNGPINSKTNSARKSAAKGAIADDTAKKGKKRKAEGDAEKAPNAKKKKKDEPKVKVPKPKGPVDVEKQCGVPLPNGALCARSLTCKSHSMGAKRAVPGRSLPYDRLLALYQQKNQAKQQRAAIDANAPLADDFATSGPVDSEEEKELVMAAISRARPQPLATRSYISTRSRYQYIRMKDMLHNALGGSRGAGLFATGPQEPGHGNRGLSLGVFGSGLGSGHPSGLDTSVSGISGFGANGYVASPLNSAGLDSAGFESHSRRSSVAGPRVMVPVPQSRKQSLAASGTA